MTLILTVLTVFLILVASEWWWRRRKTHGEVSRKFIHITVGSFAAFWPLFLDWWQILLLSAAFIVVVLVSRYFGIFRTIHTVERPTWGEVYFALAVGGLALLTHNNAIYAAALLHMGLADGLAAIIGVRYGAHNSYKVLGHTKSIAGTLTFLFCSMIILIVYATVTPHLIAPVILVALAIVATALENVSVRGLDNIVVPAVVAIALHLVS